MGNGRIAASQNILRWMRVCNCGRARVHGRRCSHGIIDVLTRRLHVGWGLSKLVGLADEVELMRLTQKNLLVLMLRLTQHNLLVLKLLLRQCLHILKLLLVLMHLEIC